MRWMMVVGLLGPAAAHAAMAPTLRQVVLSTAGTGQFVFEAPVSGTEPLVLDVKLDQVDDLLKSLVVDDPAGGRASVRLPGREPLSETFRTLPFGADALGSLDTLLAALVGETVRLPAAPGGPLSGTVLAVTSFDQVLPNGGGTLARHRLALLTPAGLASVVLEEAGPVDLASDTLRGQIATALAAVAAGRVQDRRRLAVVPGPGESRTLRFGYVVAAPVWKASYRVVLPAGSDAGPRLAGFAVVENLSGQDWRGVDLVLTSGQPVLYHQALYDPVFTARPEAPVEVPNRLMPTLDARAVPAEKAVEPPPPPPAPAPAAAPRMLQMARNAAAPSSPEPAAVEPPAVAPAAVEAGVAQVRFHLADKVDAASGQSLLLPVVDRVFPGRRVALYRFGEDDIHPLVALQLRNDTDAALPPGLATLYEASLADKDGTGAFVGDARLPAVPAGEERLLSFAADLAVTVDAQPSLQSRIATVRAARGVLDVQRREQSVTTYRIAAPAGSGRIVLIEQPRRPGWSLAETEGAMPGSADTPTHHRITVDVPAGTMRTVRVVLARDRGERVVVSDAAPALLAALAADGQVPPALKAALARAGTLRAEADRRATELVQLQSRRTALAGDQDRVRRNLGAVPNGDLQRRYLADLQAQEDQIAAQDKRIAAAQAASDAAAAALADYLAALTL